MGIKQLPGPAVTSHMCLPALCNPSAHLILVAETWNVQIINARVARPISLRKVAISRVGVDLAADTTAKGLKWVKQSECTTVNVVEWLGSCLYALFTCRHPGFCYWPLGRRARIRDLELLLSCSKSMVKRFQAHDAA
jgi:hypothetical protein